jgi:hypothetical protein
MTAPWKTAVALCFIGTAALASPEVLKVRVAPFSGPGANALRKVVVSRLAATPDVMLVDDLGQARDVVIDGTVTARGGRRQLTLEVRFAESSERTWTRRIRGSHLASLKKQLAGPVAKQLTAFLQTVRPPAPPPKELPSAIDLTGAEAPVAPKEQEAQAISQVQPQDPEKVGRRRLVHFELASLAFSRRYQYRDDLFHALSGYRLRAAPAGILKATVYPIALLEEAPDVAVGLTAGLEQALGLSSTRADGSKVNTLANASFIGVVAQYDLGRFELEASGTFGQHTYAAQTELLPDVAYLHQRAGLGVTFWGRGWSVGTSAGYRRLLSAGGLSGEEWFPRLTGAGVDAEVFGTMALSPSFRLKLGVGARRYFFAFHPEPGDRHVAGGAVDQYLLGSLGLTWTYDRTR